MTFYSVVCLVTKTILENIKTHLSELSIYSHIWTVDKDKYIKKFKAQEPTPEIFDEAITMYGCRLHIIEITFDNSLKITLQVHQLFKLF